MNCKPEDAGPAPPVIPPAVFFTRSISLADFAQLYRSKSADFPPLPLSIEMEVEKRALGFMQKVFEREVFAAFKTGAAGPSTLWTVQEEPSTRQLTLIAKTIKDLYK